MSTKASPPATISTSIATANAVVVSSIASSSSSSEISLITTPSIISTTGVKIKKEIANDEIKDFAETAMNELLGWYGYDNVELSAKGSRLMTRNLHNQNCNINNNNNDLNCNKNNNRDDSTTSDRDSSREDSKSPCSTKNSEKLETNCGWCRRIVPENSPEFLTTTDGPRYCSESCFAQSRRASFKRAKQCDWCRHIRHAVSYVDFQDGASQLQFCSDKCLNQYKMQIFCKETQAHLDMNPHLKEKLNDTGQSGSLITPDLWLKNCRSRSISPVSDVSRSPTPSIINNTLNNLIGGQLQSNTNNNHNSTLPVLSGHQQQQQQNPHKPLISVAPASKLMSKNANKNSITTVTNLTTPSTTTISVLNNRQSPGKHGGRKKRVNLGTRSSIMHQINNNNNNQTNNNNNLNNNNNNNNNLVSNNNKSNKILLNSLNLSTNSAISKTYQNVQDLRLNIPSISPNDLTVQHVHHQQHHPGRQNLPIPQPTHSFFSHSPGSNNFQPQLRPPFLSPPPPLPPGHHHHHHALHARLMGGGIPPSVTPHQQHQIHHQLPHQTPHIIQNDINPLAALIGSTPPVTIMVPYPIILPIPIPIPLPIIDFLRAANLLNNNNNNNTNNTNEENSKNIGNASSDGHKENINLDSQKNPEGQKLSINHNEKSSIDKKIINDQEIEKIFNCSYNDEPLDFTKSKVTKLNEENLHSIIIDENDKKLDEKLCNKSIEDDDDEISNSSQLIIDKLDHMENKNINSITKIDIDDNNDEIQEENNSVVKQKVPKFKITRLHTKRLITTTTTHKESECNRPLRKRKRIIDCYVTSREGEKDEKVKK